MLNQPPIKSLFLITVALFFLLTASQVTLAQSCVTSPTGLVSWWPGGGNANDIVGQNNGTLRGGATFAPGEVGQSFSFDGVDGFVEIPDSPNLTPPTAITLEAWVKPNSLGLHTIVSKYSRADASWVLWDLGTGRLRLEVRQDGPGSIARDWDTNSPVLTVGVWQHVAATFDAATQEMKIYVNGVEAPSTLGDAGSVITSIFDSNSPVRIGAVQDGNGITTAFWSGLIDEVSIYNRALTASEIQSIFNAGSAGKCKAVTVAIDIKPGEFPNSINLGSNGVVPVAILSSAAFDATTVNPTTITLAGASVRLRGNGAPMASFQDVNGDGRLDLVVQVNTKALQLSDGDTQATLTGQTFDGESITGTDSVRIVP